MQSSWVFLLLTESRLQNAVWNALASQITLSAFITQSVLILVITLTLVPDLVLSLVELHEVRICPLLKLSRSFWMSSLPSMALLSLISSANLLRVCSIPLFVSLLVPVTTPTPEGHRLLLISLWTLSGWPQPFGYGHPTNSLSIE